MEFLHTFQTFWTVFVFILFVGIILWAWSGSNKATFEEASRIPLEEDDVVITTNNKENSNG